MTATYESFQRSRGTAPALTIIPARDRVAARQEAITALDSFVRPMLAGSLRLPFIFPRPSVELTAYDEVFRRSAAGGHWTLTSRWTGLLTHTIACYTVALHFDGDDRPSHFVISGARETVTDDATPESLGRGLAAAALAGPLVTWAPNFPPDISL